MKKATTLLMILFIGIIISGCDYMNNKKESQGLLYIPINNGESYEATLGACFDSKIIIDSEYNEKEVTSIYFSGASRIKSIFIPNTITSIRSYAFSDAFNLEEVKFEEDSKVETIGSYAFFNCTKLEKIEIPTSVETIGGSAFRSCLSLKSLNIPGKVTAIGDNTFHETISLTKIEVASNNSDFVSDDGVLYDKDKETIIKYPADKGGGTYNILNSTKMIGDFAFEYTKNLSTIKIPSEVANIGDSAFYYSGVQTIEFDSESELDRIENSVFANAVRLKNIILPISIESIGTSAFYACYSLKTIIIPENVTVISSSAFSNCVALNEILIPESVNNIGSGAFSYCYELTRITIPMEVTVVGYSAFFSSGIVNVTILRDKTDGITEFGTNVFSNVSEDLVIFVPANSVLEYQEDVNLSPYDRVIQAKTE